MIPVTRAARVSRGSPAGSRMLAANSKVSRTVRLWNRTSSCRGAVQAGGRVRAGGSVGGWVGAHARGWVGGCKVGSAQHPLPWSLTKAPHHVAPPGSYQIHAGPSQHPARRTNPWAPARCRPAHQPHCHPHTPMSCPATAVTYLHHIGRDGAESRPPGDAVHQHAALQGAAHRQPPRQGVQQTGLAGPRGACAGDCCVGGWVVGRRR